MLSRVLDPQAIRHASLGTLARRTLYAWLVRDAWPPTLRAPDASAPVRRLTSENVYVHLPFCVSRCPHCPYTAFVARAEDPGAYAAALHREIGSYLATGPVPRIRTLYFGGGTPSLTPELVESTIRQLREVLAPNAEIGVEVHPRDATPALLHRLRDAGVTRVSLGVETLDARLLRLLGRRYAPDDARNAIRAAKDAGFECVDVNLIFGIPGQRPDGAEADARAVLDLDVDQISAYPLFAFPYTPLGRAIDDGRVRAVDDGTRLDAQRRVSAACRRAGLDRTSVWSFTRPGVSAYSTVTRDDYVGFGVGAGTSVRGELRFNTFSLDAYTASAPRPALELAPTDRFRRIHWIYWQIYRTELDPARYRALFDRDLEHDIAPLLSTLRLLGLAKRADGVWRLTERGAVWVHRAQALFSLAFIDELWGRARDEAWPVAVELR